MYGEAQELLEMIIEEGLLEARGIVGFYPAVSVGDDIWLYEDEMEVGGSNPAAVLHGLRQQAEVENQVSCQCISDFVPPRKQARHDYIGMFAVSTGFGCQELCAR